MQLTGERACTSACHTQAGHMHAMQAVVDAQPSHFKINSSWRNPRATTSAGDSASDGGPLAMIIGCESHIAHCQLIFGMKFQPVWSSLLRR